MDLDIGCAAEQLHLLATHTHTAPSREEDASVRRCHQMCSWIDVHWVKALPSAPVCDIAQIG